MRLDGIARATSMSGCTAACSGLTRVRRRPVRMASMARRAGPARCSASSSVSAASTPAVTMKYGSSRVTLGANERRYHSAASTVEIEVPMSKWWAKANGSPSSPASWAE